MKKAIISVLVIAVVAGWSMAIARAAETEEKGKVETITGEVVDMNCYLDHGAKGEKHKQCATTCIQGGLPVGILTDKTVYLIVGDHKPINDKLAPLAAEKVKVTGEVASRQGVHLIMVKDPDKDIVKE
jgi:hypothetical protein